MIAVDTSVWADFFRGTAPHVGQLMLTAQIVHSPVVTGELAMGNLRDRDRTIAMLQQLDHLLLPSDASVLNFVRDNELFGTGISLSDAQILASVVIDGSCRLWTRDKRLKAQAGRLGCDYHAPA